MDFDQLATHQRVAVAYLPPESGSDSVRLNAHSLARCRESAIGFRRGTPNLYNQSAVTVSLTPFLGKSPGLG